MIHQLLTKLDSITGVSEAQAHCDVPCGIYDPITAQMAALTVIRFMDLIAEYEGKELSLADQAKLSRLVSDKEVHAEKAKHEVRIIWGDYFKQPQFEKFPNTHTLVHNIMLKGSACKQGINRQDGVDFLNLINEFAESFWVTKDVATKKAKSPYLPGEMLVYPAID